MSSDSKKTLSLRNLSCQFGNFKAVNDVSEDFTASQVNCIIGPNGAGKSTLLNMICGTLAPTAGEITFGDQAIHGLSERAIAQLGIARKFQVPTVFSSLSVKENLLLAAIVKTNIDRYEDVLIKTGLQNDENKPASDLAHGKKQWLEIGMALMMNPAVLLLDEPTAGLSVSETQATAELLNSLREKMIVLVIEHDMAFVRELNARTVVLNHGELIASGSFAEIENNTLVRDVYLGRR